MKREQYPPQEPLSEAGTAYGEECWRRGAEVAFSEFAYGPDPYQRLLVAKASPPDGRVLLFWHGGGWTSGYKEWMAFMAPAFNAAGVTFVSAGYRLAPQHLFPAGVEDCAKAVKWVAENIADSGGDPAQLFVGGHSSGGHYAALLAVDDAWRKKLGLPSDILRGCLTLSGVFEFGEGSGLSARPRFLGEDPANDTRASPRLQLKARTPPFSSLAARAISRTSSDRLHASPNPYARSVAKWKRSRCRIERTSPRAMRAASRKDPGCPRRLRSWRGMRGRHDH